MDLANAEWSQALRELMKGEGYDLRKGMETRIVELEEQLKEEIVKKEEQLEQQRLVRAQALRIYVPSTVSTIGLVYARHCCSQCETQGGTWRWIC